MTIVRSIVRLLICGCVLASCCHDKRYYYLIDRSTTAGVNVRFDWSRYPAASPASMGLVVFCAESQPVQFPFAGRDGGSMVLPSGSYAFVAFNDDTENLYTVGDNWDAFALRCRYASMTNVSPMFAQTRNVPRAPSTEEQAVVAEPDFLWTAARGITPVESYTPNLLSMTMRSATFEYVFVINDVENLSYVSELAATLSGMSDGWLPYTHTSTDTESIIPFTMTSGGASTVTGRVRTFGHCPGRTANHARHMLVLYASLKDGSKYYYTFDVTDAMHDANHVSDGRDDTTVPIVLGNVPLPKPLDNGSGLQPEVNDWHEVEIPLPM